MRGKSYTFYIASSPGKAEEAYRAGLCVARPRGCCALIGSITVTAAVGSYSRMLWKVGNYNALRHDQETLKKQYQQLQSTVNDTNQRTGFSAIPSDGSSNDLRRAPLPSGGFRSGR